MPAMNLDQLVIVRVAEIDDQHRAIVEMINSFHDALLSPDPARLGTEGPRIWSSLTRTFSEHFASEQTFMASIGYPALAEHTARHRAFLDRLTEVKDDAENGFIPLNSELIKTLSGWFISHETEEDMKYAAYYRGLPR